MVKKSGACAHVFPRAHSFDSFFIAVRRTRSSSSFRWYSFLCRPLFYIFDAYATILYCLYDRVNSNNVNHMLMQCNRDREKCISINLLFHSYYSNVIGTTNTNRNHCAFYSFIIIVWVQEEDCIHTFLLCLIDSLSLQLKPLFRISFVVCRKFGRYGKNKFLLLEHKKYVQSTNDIRYL